jgi:N-acetylglucosaminyldiphosphoundecaprenol N-acetyl-beta-D-mannosaminyltransferase
VRAGIFTQIAASPPLQPPAAPHTVEVAGVPLAVSDYERVLDWIWAVIRESGRAYVTAAAVNLVMSASEDPDARDAVLGATLAVPDGQPLVWALRALGNRSATRVYGPDLMAHACARAAADGTAIFLYGGRTPEALAELQQQLRARFSGLQIAGAYWPPFRDLTGDEERAVAEQINASGAAIVWVGTGQPKQEKWMLRMRPRLEAPVLVGVGAAFDFHAGLVTQAPRWMQRAGLEWSYRLAREPRRLWRRYARYNPLFMWAFARQYLRHWRARRR